MNKLRIVFDTNIFISGLLSDKSAPQKAVDYAQAKSVILISQETFQELAEVLTRSKFDRYVSLEKRAKFLKTLSVKAEIIEVITRIDLCRDPKDNKFLELAFNGNADYLITGDNDLLSLNPFKSIAIIPPTEFINQHLF